MKTCAHRLSKYLLIPNPHPSHSLFPSHYSQSDFQTYGFPSDYILSLPIIGSIIYPVIDRPLVHFCPHTHSYHSPYIVPTHHNLTRKMFSDFTFRTFFVSIEESYHFTNGPPFFVSDRGIISRTARNVCSGGHYTPFEHLSAHSKISTPVRSD